MRILHVAARSGQAALNVQALKKFSIHQHDFISISSDVNDYTVPPLVEANTTPLLLLPIDRTRPGDSLPRLRS